MFIRRYATSATRARGFLATGGTIFDYDGMRVHRFTGNGAFTVRRGSAEVEVLLVGSGEHGGGQWFTWAQGSRGGAGGEVKVGTVHVSPGAHTVRVSPANEGIAEGVTSFGGLQAGRSPHNPGNPFEWRGAAGGRYLHGGGG